MGIFSILMLLGLLGVQPAPIEPDYHTEYCMNFAHEDVCRSVSSIIQPKCLQLFYVHFSLHCFWLRRYFLF